MLTFALLGAALQPPLLGTGEVLQCSFLKNAAGSAVFRGACNASNWAIFHLHGSIEETFLMDVLNQLELVHAHPS